MIQNQLFELVVVLDLVDEDAEARHCHSSLCQIQVFQLAINTDEGLRQNCEACVPNLVVSKRQVLQLLGNREELSQTHRCHDGVTIVLLPFLVPIDSSARAS